jgi:hypothetical protein
MTARFDVATDDVTPGLSIVEGIVNDSFDGDEWGTVMGAAFAIAEALYRRDETIPDAWEYRPGLMMGAEDQAREDSYVLDMILSAVDAGDATYDDLRNAGDGLMVIRERLITEEKDY